MRKSFWIDNYTLLDFPFVFLTKIKYFYNRVENQFLKSKMTRRFILCFLLPIFLLSLTSANLLNNNKQKSDLNYFNDNKSECVSTLEKLYYENDTNGILVYYNYCYWEFFKNFLDASLFRKRTRRLWKCMEI